MRKAILSILISSLIILPFGNIFAQGTNYRYTGQENNPNSNLYYYGQRYYDPSVGRFTQPDPVSKYLNDPQKLNKATGQDLQKLLENPQALNEYSYTQNNPIRYTDPNGESAAYYGIGVGGVLGMAYSYKRVGSFLNNLVRGNFYSAGDDADKFLETTGKGVILGVTIGAAIDTIWGLVGLVKMSNQYWQVNNSNRTIRFSESTQYGFAQKTVSSTFSNDAQTPGFLRGRQLNDVVSDLQGGKISASQIEVNYVIRDGVMVINNNRSAVVLQRAGIDISKWNLINRTGQDFYENSVSNQLLNNNLPSAGSKSIKY